MQEKYRVVVTDDFRISRTFFEMMVQSDLKYALAASFSNAQDAVQYCLQNPVDLLILVVMMRTGIDGITAARQIKEQCPEIKIILATSTAETAWEEQAREIGVESFWYKEYSDESLVEVMDRTLEGDKVYPKKPVDIEIGNIKRVALTERDLDVLRELTLGYTNDEIAERLHISVNTVRTHVQNMLNKTGFKNHLGAQREKSPAPRYTVKDEGLRLEYVVPRYGRRAPAREDIRPRRDGSSAVER